MKAAINGKAETVKLLLQKGANPNAIAQQGMIKLTPLMMAVQSGDANTVEALLKGGADPNAEFGVAISALDSAAQDGRLEIVNVLLSHDAKPRGLDVEWAAEKGHSDVAVAILRYIGGKYGRSEARSWQKSYCPACKL